MVPPKSLDSRLFSSTRSRAVASAPSSCGGGERAAGEIIADDAVRPAGIGCQLAVGQLAVASAAGFPSPQPAQDPGKIVDGSRRAHLFKCQLAILISLATDHASSLETPADSIEA